MSYYMAKGVLQMWLREQTLRQWRVSWIIWAGPKCNHRCPHQRQSERFDYRRRRPCVSWGKMLCPWLWSSKKEHWAKEHEECSSRSQTARKGPLPSRLQRPHSPATPWMWALWHQCGMSGLQQCKGIDVCCLKPPSTWWYVRAAAGNQYIPSLWFRVSAYVKVWLKTGPATLGLRWIK